MLSPSSRSRSVPLEQLTVRAACMGLAASASSWWAHPERLHSVPLRLGPSSLVQSATCSALPLRCGAHLTPTTGCCWTLPSAHHARSSAGDVVTARPHRRCGPSPHGSLGRAPRHCRRGQMLSSSSRTADSRAVLYGPRDVSPIVVGAPNAPPPCAAALGTVVSRAGGNVQCVATLLWRALDADDGLLLDTAVRTSCSLVGWRRRDRATSSSLWSVATRLAGQSARHCRRGQMLSPSSRSRSVPLEQLTAAPPVWASQRQLRRGGRIQSASTLCRCAWGRHPSCSRQRAVRCHFAVVRT